MSAGGGDRVSARIPRPFVMPLMGKSTRLNRLNLAHGVSDEAFKELKPNFHWTGASYFIYRGLRFDILMRSGFDQHVQGKESIAFEDAQAAPRCTATNVNFSSGDINGYGLSFQLSHDLQGQSSTIYFILYTNGLGGSVLLALGYDPLLKCCACYLLVTLSKVPGQIAGTRLIPLGFTLDELGHRSFGSIEFRVEFKEVTDKQLAELYALRANDVREITQRQGNILNLLLEGNDFIPNDTSWAAADSVIFHQSFLRPDSGTGWGMKPDGLGPGSNGDLERATRFHNCSARVTGSTTQRLEHTEDEDNDETCSTISADERIMGCENSAASNRFAPDLQPGANEPMSQPNDESTTLTTIDGQRVLGLETKPGRPPALLGDARVLEYPLDAAHEVNYYEPSEHDHKTTSRKISEKARQYGPLSQAALNNLLTFSMCDSLKLRRPNRRKLTGQCEGISTSNSRGNQIRLQDSNDALRNYFFSSQQIGVITIFTRRFLPPKLHSYFNYFRAPFQEGAQSYARVIYDATARREKPRL